MSTVVRRPLAVADVADVWAHIADDSIEQADAWLDRLDAKLQLLATQPMMGRAREEIAPGVRSLPFGKYLIVYQPITDGIDVMRFLHSARDLESVFAKDPPEV